MPATGPISQIGKAKMRENPLKHGLTAKHIVIPGESAEEYNALRADLFQSYQPVTAGEEVLTNQIVEGYWRLMRARKVEADFWKKAMGPDQDLGRAFRDHADEHKRMHRYVTTIQRDYYKAIRELQNEQSIRQERLNTQQPTQPESVSQKPENTSATRPTPEILASCSSLLAPTSAPIPQTITQKSASTAVKPTMTIFHKGGTR